MYSPKIDEKHIPILYQLGRQVKKPMTHLVNEAITEYLFKTKVTA